MKKVVHRFTGEEITFVEKTNEFLLIEVSLPPEGNGPPLHCHDRFTEEFTVLEGILTISHNGVEKQLHPGESIFVPLHDAHTFTNNSTEQVRFHVKLTTGDGFEESVRIHYGLMDDGLTNEDGVPKNIFHLAYILYLQNTLIAGKSLKVQRALFKTIISIGKMLGVIKKLDRYVTKSS